MVRRRSAPVTLRDCFPCPLKSLNGGIVLFAQLSSDWGLHDVCSISRPLFNRVAINDNPFLTESIESESPAMGYVRRGQQGKVSDRDRIVTEKLVIHIVIEKRKGVYVVRICIFIISFLSNPMFSQLKWPHNSLSWNPIHLRHTCCLWH